MSASDSDCSIDWLASDDEDHDSELELEPDYNRPAEGATILPEPASPRETRGSGDLQQLSKRSGNAYEMNAEKKGAEKEDNCSLDGLSSSCSSPSSCDGGEQGLPHPRVLERGGCPWGSDRNPKDIKRQAQKRPRGSAMPEERDRPTTQGQTEKDRLFACKCMELQCYIHPLSLILHGLRSGRYRERLSSFQESVALDRIQRIMGVLQNPCMGERYINIILKMEEMLKSWFPHIKPRDQHAPAEQNEGSNPAKKPRFSPAQPVGTPPTAGALPAAVKAMRASDLTPPGPYSATNLKWLHTSPICSPGTEQSQGGVRNFLTARGDRDLTQDNSVSSSTDTARAKLDSAPSRPPPGKINAPCLERLLKSTESIVNVRKGTGGLQGSGYS